MSHTHENRDDKVSLVEMGPRDGLQNETATLSLAQRLALIAHLAESGLQRIEVGAFVSPKKVPQMADSAALFNGSSRDLGEVEVDRQGAGKLAVSKHTTTITLLSPCIILILPPSGQVIPSSPKRFLPTITPCLPLSLAPTSCPVVADACNPRH